MDQKNRGEGIDPFSFQLGMINCFAEMVACGVKQLAISPPLSPSEHDALESYSEQIVKGFGIASYLENSLMDTLLQSPAFTLNKCSILYYKTETTLAAYLDLKERQARLIASDGYDTDAQKAISAAFGYFSARSDSSFKLSA